jgi:hypothetical protein
MSIKGSMKGGDYSGSHQMGWKNHNRLLLSIPDLNIRCTFRSSIFSQANTNANVTETYVRFI